MRPFALRSEDPPGDDVMIVRAGQMTTDTVRRSTSKFFEEHGIYALSVFATLDHPVEELCRDHVLARYGSVRTSTFGTVRAAGFALLPTLRRPHFSVVLPDLDSTTLDRLSSCFSEPVPNPGRTL